MAISHSYLSDLPVEILRLVTASLARKDLKALRKTNRKLHSIASEKLFETIAITTNCASYVQLLNVAAPDVWSAQVRHIDWVLLHGFECYTLLTQEIKFNEAWSTTLTKWQVSKDVRFSYESRNVYPGLSLQCLLLQRFPNVQTVRFWVAVECQRNGREPWETSNDRSGAIETSRFIRTVEDDIPSPNDFISILRSSDLRPRLIKTAAARMYLSFSTGKKFLKSVQILPHQSGGSRYDSREHYRGASNLGENRFDSASIDCIRSLAHSGISTLTVLRVSAMRTYFEYMEILLRANINLRILYLKDVELYDIMNKAAVTDFLLLLKGFYDQGCLHGLKVTLQNLSCHHLSGRFSATEQEVQSWMEGEIHELLKIASSAVTPGFAYPYSNHPFICYDKPFQPEMDDIKDMDSEDEEIGYFSVKENRHRKFNECCGTEEKIVTGDAVEDNGILLRSWGYTTGEACVDRCL